MFEFTNCLKNEKTAYYSYLHLRAPLKPYPELINQILYSIVANCLAIVRFICNTLGRSVKRYTDQQVMQEPLLKSRTRKTYSTQFHRCLEGLLSFTQKKDMPKDGKSTDYLNLHPSTETGNDTLFGEHFVNAALIPFWCETKKLT